VQTNKLFGFVKLIAIEFSVCGFEDGNNCISGLSGNGSNSGDVTIVVEGDDV